MCIQIEGEVVLTGLLSFNRVDRLQEKGTTVTSEMREQSADAPIRLIIDHCIGRQYLFLSKLQFVGLGLLSELC